MNISEELERYYDFWFGINAIYEKWAKMYNLTVNSLFALYTLFNSKDECTQKMICDKLVLSKQTVNALLASLIKSGYVDKKNSNIDKRNKHLSLTLKGYDFAKNVIKELDNFEIESFKKMSGDDRTSLIRTSEMLLNNFTESFNSKNK